MHFRYSGKIGSGGSFARAVSKNMCQLYMYSIISLIAQASEKIDLPSARRRKCTAPRRLPIRTLMMNEEAERERS